MLPTVAYGNSLLRSFEPGLFSALEPHLHLVPLNLTARLANAGEPIRAVYFPISGIVSYVVELESGSMIEAAMAGRDGAVNAGPALDGKIAPHTAIVQMAGEALMIESRHFQAVSEAKPSLMKAVLAYEMMVLAQSQQSAACNALHKVEARMCRWLLRMRDLVEANELRITQEYLAHMLGVQRGSVSIVATALQREGIIRYSRGNIRIVDTEKLQRASCECYEAVRTLHKALFGENTLGTSLDGRDARGIHLHASGPEPG